MEEGLSLSIGALLGKEVLLRRALRRRGIPRKKQRRRRDPKNALAELLAGLTQVTLHRESSGRGGRMVTLCPLEGERIA